MDQVRRIDQLSLTELFAIKDEEGENTSEAVLAAIEAKQAQAPSVTKPAPAPSV